MGIDPMLYQKYSGRSGDPHTRLGEALAKNEKRKSRRDGMAKGVAGGVKVSMMPGSWWNVFYFWKWFSHSRRDD